MDADFDLSRLNEIPDVLPPAVREATEKVPPLGPRASATSSGPARGSVRAQRAAALAVSAGWLVIQVLTLGFRSDFAKLGLSYPLAQIGLPAALSALALGLAIWPGKEGLGAGVAPLRTVAIAGLGAMTIVAFAWPLPFPYTPPSLFGFSQWVLICADIVAVMGAVPLVLAAVVFRRSFATAATERSAAVGTACALGAVTAMHLHCENMQPAHMLAAHMVPAIGLAVIATLILRHTARA